MKKILKILGKKKIGKFNLFAALICVLYILAFSLIAVNRYWQYEVFYYDFGIFDKAIWSVSRFQPPIIEHFIVGGKWIFADHFNPSIFLLSPLYWITNKNEVLLIAQAMAVGISGFLLFQIGQVITKNKIFSLGIMISYLLFIGVQNALISDFHEVTIAAAFFMAAMLCLVKGKIRFYYLFLLITLGFKESNFVIGSALGLSLMLLGKEYRKIGLATMVLSLIWGAAAIKVIIPAFSGGQYIYNAPIPDNPLRFLQSFIDPPIKQKTLFISFLNFGFLPIFTPAFYPLLLADLTSRFYPPFLTLSWGLGLHYNMLTAAFLGVSSVFSHKFLKKYIPESVFTMCGILLIGITLFLHRFVLHGPLGLAFNKSFYTHSQNFAFLDDLVKRIPPDATVMTQNNLASHFTHQDVRLLRDKCNICSEEHYLSVMPEYVVIDNRLGQNPNNYYGVDDLGKILKVLQKDKDYQIIYSQKDQYIFKRK